MELVSSNEEISSLKNNSIIGNISLEKSKIKFSGSGNMIVCKNNVKLKSCTIRFDGNNSLIYMCGGVINAKIIMANNCVLYVGNNCFFNPYSIQILIKCSEQKHFFVGDHCMISTGVSFENSDAHLIYSIDTRERINSSASIFIGDRVWLGQNVQVLKNSKIHSGSVIGANSVCAGKRIPSNCVAAGNPCRVIKENVFWRGQYSHLFDDEQTRLFSHSDDSDEGIFNFDKSQYIPFEELDSLFSEKISAAEKVNRIDEEIQKYRKRFCYKEM